MKIGELAKRAGCDVETIRYYEREGLLAAPPRSEGNYRSYAERDVIQLIFIRHCRSLGIPLHDIRTLQECQGNPELACNQVDALFDKQLQQIQLRIQSLEHLQRQMTALRNACRSDSLESHCGILENLNQAATAHTCICHSS